MGLRDNRLNILVLNYEFPPIGGGAGVVAYDISKRLAEAGHQVTVVTMGFEQLPSYEEKDGMRIYRVKCIRKKKAVCYPWEQLSYILSAVHFLRRHMKENHYDINHSHFIIPTGPISYWLKKKYGLEYVITSHGSDVAGYNQKRFKFLHKILIGPWRVIVQNAREVISPSLYLKDLLEKSGPGLKKYPIIPNGIELETYLPLKSREKKNHVIVMCRLQEAKNVQTVIRGFARFVSKTEYKDWHLDILGDGPYKEVLENLAKELGINDKVQFHGWVPNRSEKQLELLGQAKIYVSASTFENCPMSVLEALAAGVYPLVSDIPAHRQILPVENQLFGMNDIVQLSEKLAEAAKLTDWNLPLDISAYDWKVVMQKYEEILQ